jgi:hypothetical protein
MGIGNIYSLNNSLLSPLSHCWTFGVRMSCIPIAKVWKIKHKRNVLLGASKGIAMCNKEVY